MKRRILIPALTLLIGFLAIAPAGAETPAAFVFTPQIETPEGTVYPVDGSVSYDQIVAAFGEPSEKNVGVFQGEIEPGEPDGNMFDTRIMYRDQYGWSEGCFFFANDKLLRVDGAVWVGGDYSVTELFTISGISSAVTYQEFWSMMGDARFEDRNLAVELYYGNQNGVPVFITATGQGKTFTGGNSPWTETVYSEEDLSPWREAGLWRMYYKEEGALIYLPPQAR